MDHSGSRLVLFFSFFPQRNDLNTRKSPVWAYDNFDHHGCALVPPKTCPASPFLTTLLRYTTLLAVVLTAVRSPPIYCTVVHPLVYVTAVIFLKS